MWAKHVTARFVDATPVFEHPCVAAVRGRRESGRASVLASDSGCM